MPDLMPKIGTAIALLILGLLLGTLAAAIVMVALGISLEDTVSIQSVLLAAELLLPLPIILHQRRWRAPIARAFRLNPVPPSSLWPVAVFGVGLIMVTDEIDRLAQKVLPLPAEVINIQTIMVIRDWQSALFIIGVVALLAPLAEELIFRGFLQRILEHRLRDVTRAVLISALIFAIIHFNPWWVIQIYLIGLFMGYFAWRSNSVWPGFILHALNNGLAVLLVNSPDGWLAWYEWRGHVAPYMLLLAVGLMIYGMKRFNAAMPVAGRDQAVILIEDYLDSSHG